MEIKKGIGTNTNKEDENGTETAPSVKSRNEPENSRSVVTNECGDGVADTTP